MQIKFGMGIKISASGADGRMGESGMGGTSDMIDDDLFVVDHGSRFAKSLGFYEDADWSLALPESGAPFPIEDGADAQRHKGELQEHAHTEALAHARDNGLAEGNTEGGGGGGDEADSSVATSPARTARYRRYSDLTEQDALSDEVLAEYAAARAEYEETEYANNQDNHNVELSQTGDATTTADESTAEEE